MKNLLIIAYYFPPCTHVGSYRPASLAKYAAREGWRVTVLAATFPGTFDNGGEYHIERVPDFDVLQWFKLANRSRPAGGPANASPVENAMLPTGASMKRLAKSILAFPDRHNGWLLPALRIGRRLIEERGIDAIVSTSSPQTTAILARQLATEFRLPWVADFRDLWTQYQRYGYGNARRRIERRLEVWTLSRADALVTVTEPLAAAWRGLHPSHRIVVIPNSFDPELVPRPSAPQDDVLTITLTGKVIQGCQDPSILFEALAALIDVDAQWKRRINVRFIGPHLDWLAPLVSRYRVNDVVELLPPVSRAKALQHQVDSSLLLVLSWTDPSQTGVLTGKLPEYLGAAVPVIAIGPFADATAEVLHETRAGHHFASPGPLMQYLQSAYEQLLQGGIAYRGDPDAVRRYAAPEMARRVLRVVSQATDIR